MSQPHEKKLTSCLSYFLTALILLLGIKSSWLALKLLKIPALAITWATQTSLGSVMQLRHLHPREACITSSSNATWHSVSKRHWHLGSTILTLLRLQISVISGAQLFMQMWLLPAVKMCNCLATKFPVIWAICKLKATQPEILFSPNIPGEFSIRLFTEQSQGMPYVIHYEYF